MNNLSLEFSVKMTARIYGLAWAACREGVSHEMLVRLWLRCADMSPYRVLWFIELRQG